MKELTYIVNEAAQGFRLDVYLTAQMEGSRSYVQQLIKDGQVVLEEGGRVKKSQSQCKVGKGYADSGKYSTGS